MRLELSKKTARNNLNSSKIYAKPDARRSADAALRWLGAAPVLRAWELVKARGSPTPVFPRR